jgi:Tol biopolymer transport system component
VEPFWSPDSQQILYIDRPAQDAPAGLWGVDTLGSEPQFVTERLGIYSADMLLRAFPRDGATYIEDLSTGEQWSVPNGGRAVSFSADKNWVAWTAGQTGPPFNTARREIWISSVEGGQDRQVFSGIRAGFEGWFPDGRLLVSGLIDGPDSEQALWALNADQIQDGQPELVELGRGGRLREARISPNGDWVAYLSTFSTDPAQDGIWLADARSGERRRLDVFGGYQWRDDQRLLIIPLDLSQPAQRLLQVEAASGQLQAVTDPAITPFKIANSDWNVSPDGEMIAFVSAEDGNIWVLELPD